MKKFKYNVQIPVTEKDKEKAALNALKIIKSSQKSEGIIKVLKFKRSHLKKSEVKKLKESECIKRRIAKKQDDLPFSNLLKKGGLNTPMILNDKDSSYLLKIRKKDNNYISECIHKGKKNCKFEIPLSEISN